ncbi:MAG: histidinol dehydrogenase [Bacteroidales bacterium]|nr:histidinol dehydrogenase [Bacteroidales bacterium]
MEENEKVNGFVDEVKDKAADIVEDVKEKAADIVEDVKEKVDEIKEKAPEKFQEIKEDVKEAYDKASAAAKEKVDEIKAEIDDYTPEQDAEDVKNNKVFAILAYLGILVLIPLFVAKDSKFARFHTNQGLVLFLLGIGVSVVSYIPVIRWFAGLLGLVLFAFMIIGIIYAAQGKAKELPVVGNWKILK